MSGWAYVGIGWAITLVMIVVYVLVVLQRGRRLSRQVPPGEQRWL